MHSLFLLLFILYVLLVPKISRGEVDSNPNAYPVLVVPSKGFPASGVFLRTEAATFLVTARHVLLDEKTGLFKGDSALLSSFPADLKEQVRYVLKVDPQELGVTGNIKDDSRHDLIVLRVDRKVGREFRLLGGVTLQRNPKSGTPHVHSSMAKMGKDLMDGQKVYLAGYRTISAIKSPKEFDVNEPEIRVGNLLVYDRKDGYLFLNYISQLGDSGAPIFLIDEEFNEKHLRIVGIHTSTILPCRYKITLKQCGRAVAMDQVFGLINEFKR